MFKFKSYNVKKASEKNEKQQPSSSTAATPEEIKHANNKQSPTYSQKIHPKKTVTDWHQNKTFSAKNETKKVVIPTPHKKLERK